MTFFTHLKFVDNQCCGCGAMLWDLMEARRWNRRHTTVLPVCVEATNLTLIKRKKS